jgi:Glycosyl hydrolase family 12
MKLKRGLALLVSVISAGALVTPAIASPALASASICDQIAEPAVVSPLYAQATVVSYGLTYEIETGNFGGHPECLALYGNRPAFRVASSFTAPIGHVQAYPNIGLGCSYFGHCTPRSPFPIKLSALRNPRASFSYVTNHAPGGWNASIEMWTNIQRSEASHANGTEIMIWLARQNIFTSTRGLKILHIDGADWYLQTWRAGRGTPVQWNYVHFLRAHPVGYVKALPLAPFYQALERLHLLSSQWYLESMQAGFEIYSGGQGLTTTWFRAMP